MRMKTIAGYFIVIICFTSCKTFSYFERPDNLHYISGTLYLKNGQTFDGKLNVRAGKDVRIYSSDERKPQRYKPEEIKGFAIRNQYYELKEIKDGKELKKDNRFHFMKRLTTTGSKIHLYEYLDEKNYHFEDKDYDRIEKEYYVQLPSETGDGVWNIKLAKFVPNFDEKMSRYTEDCPSLSHKIADKQKGYFYPQFGGSGESRVDILWNIITEYNECK